MLPGFLLSACSGLSLCCRNGLRLQGLIFTLSPYSSLTVLWCAETSENKTKTKIVKCPCPNQNTSVYHNHLLCIFFLFPYRTHGNREGWKQNLTASRRAKDCDFPHAQCYVGLDQREKGLPYLASRCKMHPLLHSTQPKPTALRQERSGQTREMYEGIRTPKGQKELTEYSERQRAKMEGQIN